MIASEVPTSRAASIAMVLAASSFLICTPGAAEKSTARVTVISVVAVVEPELELPAVAQQEAPPPADTKWRGTCFGGEIGWPDMPITLDVQIAADGKMHATGTLAFIDRRTRAEAKATLRQRSRQRLQRIKEPRLRN